MSSASIAGKGFSDTLRADKWWIEPALVLLGIIVFVIYSFWAAMQASHYHAVSYLSPFYSPLLFIKEGVAGGAPLEHAWFGIWPSWWPAFLPASPSFLIVPFPLVFRFTCYFYRRVYYRAFAATPPACAVGSIPQKPYKGETGLMLFQNLHRYALYCVLVFIVIHCFDVAQAFFYRGRFGVGVGSIVLSFDVILLSCYVFGCHSFRHLIGGRNDCLSCHSWQHHSWKKASRLNSYHPFFAWASMGWVGFSDMYVRMVSMGIINDWNTWGA